MFTAYNPFHYSGATVTHRNMAVRAYDTETGEPTWTQEYEDTNWAPETGCQTPTWVGGASDVLKTNPSGSLVYLLGEVGTTTNNCDAFETGVLALHAATGEPAWATAYDGGGVSGLAISGCVPHCRRLVVHPDPSKDLIFIPMAFYPQPNPYPAGRSYGLTLALSASTGGVRAQYRWIDTFGAEGDQGTQINSQGGGVLSPDGSRLYVAIQEYSETRGWRSVTQVLGYLVPT